ncbi:MAG: PQQ-binding-like beta-propeller repeat protein [Opitutaceae bacterium]
MPLKLSFSAAHLLHFVDADVHWRSLSVMKAMGVLCLGFVVALAAFPGISRAAVGATDWPAWRGPTGDGQAAPGQTLPTRWSEKENVVWRAAIRGRGHSSPTVVGDRVYLTTADPTRHEQLVLCFDRANGKPVWETVVHRGKLNAEGHEYTSQASATVAWDGERLYVNFLNDGAVHTSALDPAGKILWQRRVGDFVVLMGFGSSPLVHDALVLITGDHKNGGWIAGLNKQTGAIVWKNARPKIPNYASAAVITAGGKTQMIIAGCKLVSSFDPATGKKLWELEGSTDETVVTPVSDGHRVFVGGGFPRNHIMAIDATGSGEVVWQNNSRLYTPSLLVRDGHVYAVNDSGQAFCWKAETGDQLWRGKVDREFFASPVMADSVIYATSMTGVTSVFRATPQKFAMIAQNQLGNEAFASPAICGNRIYLRAAKKSGESRQEYLWCIGQ